MFGTYVTMRGQGGSTTKALLAETPSKPPMSTERDWRPAS